jgi:putative tricarboxylic transport membrane protein
MLKTKGLRLASLAAVWVSLSAFSPSKVECIAPAAPGGGWDFTCRSVGKLLYDLKLVPQPVQVTNMPGAVGAVAFSNVVGNRNKEEGLLVATSTVGVTQIAQNRYPGDADKVRWLAMLGTDVGAVLVKKDSKYQKLGDLLSDIKAKPSSVTTGGSSSIGGWDHLRLLLLAKKAGVDGGDLRKIRWVQFEGGGPAVTQLLGGHLDVVVTDLGEISGFVESGDVRVLGLMSEKRLDPPFDKLPTAKEQGFDMVGYNWRGFYVGGGVSDNAYDGWADIMKKLYESDEWKQTAKAHGLNLIWRGGKEFEDFVRQSVKDTREISREIGVIK